jgi:hypothetical protein
LDLKAEPALARPAGGTGHIVARLRDIAILGAVAVLLAACSRPSSSTSPPPEQTITSTATPALTATGTPRPASTTATVTATPTRPPATPLSQQQLDQLALSATDLPQGFAITASGPGGPELGPDVLASYQEEFQQSNVTSTQSLQQTIVIINLLGQYKDSASALAGIRAINVQTLNQLLGSVSLTAEPATVPPVGEDSQGFHFTGTSNNVSVGGYLIVFHKGPIAALILTAAAQGGESLPQTIDLAQKQAQKLPAAG